MKKILVLLALSLMSVEGFSTESWMCTGTGVINTGGPAGPIVIPVQGTGPTQFDALQDAQQNCRMQGLQQCMINSCFKR